MGGLRAVWIPAGFCGIIILDEDSLILFSDRLGNSCLVPLTPSEPPVALPEPVLTASASLPLVRLSSSLDVPLVLTEAPTNLSCALMSF